ncbi:MAG: 4Fe-4S dicluster domain-containing protein, partial [Gemmatimonadota bacterium]
MDGRTDGAISPARQGANAHAWAGLDACVHCGFCLPACPTYEVTSDESDSPRGRIVLMRALERGELPPDDPEMASHLDRCLGCRACESVCPSGVLFGPALEAARAEIAPAPP